MSLTQLVFKDWELGIDLNGGRIVSLKNKGILILGTFQRIDGKSGNTHVCVPNFASGGLEKYGLPFHGPFRSAIWNLVSQNENLLEINCEIDNLEVWQKFFLNDEYFNQQIIIENKGEVFKPINAAIHNYWSSELGWQGIKINGIDVSFFVKQNEFVGLQQLNEIDIPGKPLIKWSVDGFKYAKLWTGFLEESGNKIFDNNYVCIEPIMEKDEEFFGKQESMLAAKSKLELKQLIGIRK